MLAGFRMTRLISVFWVFPVVGSDMLAWLVFCSRVFVLAPRRRLVFFLVSPSVVSVGNEPFSYRRLVLWVFFLPPEGFFLRRSPCQTDNLLVLRVLWRLSMNGVVYYSFLWLSSV